MKKLLIAILLFTSLAVSFNGSFCEGWKAGYKKGYCYDRYGCIAPITPICPIPYIGRNGYQDGFA